LKRKDDCTVELVKYNQTGITYFLVLKTFNKEFMHLGNKMEQALNERDVLKRISGIP
jgi:hypothetical protein